MRVAEKSLSSYSGRVQALAQRMRQAGAGRINPSIRPTELGMAPLGMEINVLSNVCNSRCSFCFGQSDPSIGKLKRKIADSDMVTSFISEAAKNGVQQVDFSAENSEPTLHEDFTKFVRVVADNELKLGLYTNAIALKPEFIEILTGTRSALGNFVIINLSAPTATDYHLVHGVNRFEAVVANLGHLLEAKEKNNGDIRIIVNYTLCQENSSLEQIQQAMELALSMGVDFFRVIFPFPPLYTRDSKTVQARLKVKVTTAEIEGLFSQSQKEDKLVLRGPQEMTAYNPTGYCWAQFQRGLLDPEGRISLCNRAYSTDANHHNGVVLGYYAKGNLAEIWQSTLRDAKAEQHCFNCAPGDALFNQEVQRFLAGLEG